MKKAMRNLALAVAVALFAAGGVLAAPTQIVNGSFEDGGVDINGNPVAGGYEGWSLTKNRRGDTNAVAFCIGKSGQTVEVGDTLKDYMFGTDFTVSDDPLKPNRKDVPKSIFPADGAHAALLLQNLSYAQPYLVYQDVTVPSLTTPDEKVFLRWNMCYCFDSETDFDALHYIKVYFTDLDNNVLKVVFQTVAGDPKMVTLTAYEADITDLAGNTVRIKVELLATDNRLLAVFDYIRMERQGSAAPGSGGDGGAIPEVCNDGADNDLDGPIDCEDSDCFADASCVTEIELDPVVEQLQDQVQDIKNQIDETKAQNKQVLDAMDKKANAGAVKDLKADQKAAMKALKADLKAAKKALKDAKKALKKVK